MLLHRRFELSQDRRRAIGIDGEVAHEAFEKRVLLGDDAIVRRGDRGRHHHRRLGLRRIFAERFDDVGDALLHPVGADVSRRGVEHRVHVTGAHRLPREDGQRSAEHLALDDSKVTGDIRSFLDARLGEVADFLRNDAG